MYLEAQAAQEEAEAAAQLQSQQSRSSAATANEICRAPTSCSDNLANSMHRTISVACSTSGQSQVAPTLSQLYETLLFCAGR